MSWWSRLRNRGRMEDEPDRERRDHVERKVADHVRAGRSAGEARQRATRLGRCRSGQGVLEQKIERFLRLFDIYDDRYARLSGDSKGMHELQSSRRGVTPTVHQAST